MPFGIGPLELIIVLVIALLVFGPKKLPELGRSLGSGMREFKDSITGGDKDDDDDKPSKLSASAEDEPDSSEKNDAFGRPRG
jgi:sec-independent protein translocase protein TatA